MAIVKKSSSIDIFKPFKKLIKRFHLTLFFIFVAGGLAGAVLLINSTLKDSATDTDYTSSINTGSIDQVTLTRLNALHTSAEGGTAPVLPAGRVNPVNE